MDCTLFDLYELVSWLADVSPTLQSVLTACSAGLSPNLYFLLSGTGRRLYDHHKATSFIVVSMIYGHFSLTRLCTVGPHIVHNLKSLKCSLEY